MQAVPQRHPPLPASATVSAQRPKHDKPEVGVFETTGIGFIHIDLKHLPALQRRKSYAFVAIDRATATSMSRSIQAGRQTAAAFLERFLAHFPHEVDTILTDNGAEFTDRFAVDMKNKPPAGPPATILLIASVSSAVSSIA